MKKYKESAAQHQRERIGMTLSKYYQQGTATKSSSFDVLGRYEELKKNLKTLQPFMSKCAYRKAEQQIARWYSLNLHRQSTTY